MASYSNPAPDTHVEVLYRQTYNTLGALTPGGLTQNNTVGNDQKAHNTQLNAATPLGILAGSVVAVAGNGLIGPCLGDSSTVFDMAVGIAVNNAVGNPFESSSGVASGKVVYAHGTGTVIRTDIYETKGTNGSSTLAYNPGDKLYASQNGLLTNASGLTASTVTAYDTLIGICLVAPSGTQTYMSVQLRI